VRFRNSVTAAAGLLALLGANALPLNGQEEPLPPVQPRTFIADAALPSVTLPVEPIRSEAAPESGTLAQAARANDYATFAALYERHPAAAWRPLYELWTYSVTDPIGAFYGEDTFTRLSRAYPGLAAAIARNRIVDDRGHTFYPTSETRTFILERVLDGDTPRTTIAHLTPTPSRTHTTSHSTTKSARVETPKHTKKPVRSADATHATPRHETRSAHANAPVHARASSNAKSATPHATKSAQTTAPQHATAAPIAPPVVVHAEPVTATPNASSSANSAAPNPAPISTTPAPIPASTASNTPVAPPTATPAPITPTVVDSTPAQEPVQLPQPPANGKPDLASRGLLLVIIGLIGIGVLAVILRTPSDAAREAKTPTAPPATPPTPPPAPQPEKPAAPVEPIRRASGQHRR